MRVSASADDERMGMPKLGRKKRSRDFCGIITYVSGSFALP